MGKRQDFAALDWVTSELTETLAQAQHAIAAYEEDNSDLTRLQFSLTYLHQVRGTLEMVEVYGAALLARELEHLAQFLVNNPKRADGENLSLLLQGILQLPAYLERLQQGSADHPAIMAPLINDIRAARELGPVDESQLFSPDLTSEESTLAVPVDPNSLTPDAREHLRKLRQLFQFSLLGLLHGKDIEQNQQYMHKAAKRLAEQLGDTGIGFLWHIAAALLEAHQKGLLPDDIDLRPALSRLERQLGHLIQATNEGRSPTVDVRLLQQLLYYIARADAQTRALADLQSRFSLQALPSEEDARVVSGREALRGPDRSTVANVSAVLVEELTEVKDQLDIFVRDRSANPQRLSELLQPLRQISDTMSMLQLGQAKRVLDEQISSLETLSREPTVEPQSVMDVAGGLLYVESTLTGLDQGYREPQASGSNEVNAARRALISEVRNAIESCKEAVVSYIGSQWDRARLTETPEWLRQIEANLAMIPLPEPAAVITSVRHYMQRELIDGGERHPDWTQMDKLADALMGVDYFLERLPRDQDKAPDGSILKRARASLRDLGYPVAEVDTDEMPESETAVKSSLDDYFEHVSELDETTIDAAWSDAEGSDTAETDETELELELEAATEADPEPAEELPAAPVAEVEDDEDDDLIDDDIRAIFLEEAGEVLEDIRDWYPRYKADPENSEALTEFRRSFHTLKGSGRMVNASVVGELAWAVENMLNRLIDGSIARSDALLQLLDDVIERLPDLIDDFAQGRASDTARVDALAARAEALSRGELPPEEDSLPMAENDAPTKSAEPEVEEVPEMAEVSAIDDDLAEEEDAGDERLYSIFQQEIRLHLEEVRSYLERHRHELEAPVEDGLQRALHTIKGSAHMAGITVMAEMVGPVEHVVRDLQTLREPVDETVMVLLEDVAGRVEDQLKALDQQETPEPATDNFFSLVKDINARLADIKSTGQAEPSSNLMSIFLNEAMNTVLNAEDTLQEWQKSGLEDSRLRLLRRDLITLADAARAIELLPLSSLANQLILLYEFLEQHPPESSDHPAFDGLYRAHEAIIDMMDRLAAGQSVQEQTALETELAELANAPLAGPSELPVDENDYALSNLTAQRGHIDAPVPVEHEAEPVAAEDQPPWPEVTGKEPGNEPIASEIDEPEPTEAAASESVSASEEAPPWDTADNTASANESATTEPEAKLEPRAEPETEPQAEPEAAAPELPAAPPAVGEWVALQDSDPEVLEIFLEEADELLASIGEELDTWQKEPADRSPVTALQRDLHTLKGGARMAEAAAVADLAHELEFIYEGLGTGQMAASQALLQEVQRSQDQLAQMVQDLHERQGCHEATEQIQRLQALRRGEAPTKARQASPQNEAEAPEKTALDAATDSADFFSPVELENLDPDILEVFMDEAIELINELDESITAWRDRPSNELAADEMKRVLHTLKGGARLARLPSLGTLSHELETYVIRAQQNRVPLDDQFFSQVLNQYDLLATGVEQLQAVMDSGAPSSASSGGAPEEAAESNVVPFQRPEAQDEQKGDAGDSSPPAGGGGNAAPARRTQPQETVKVSANLLENLVNLAGESSISRARLEEQVNDLGFTLNDLDTTIDRLREKVRQLDIETEAQVLFRQERAEETNYEDFDPLEMDRYTQIQELSRSLMETSSDLVDLRNTLSNKSRDAETVLLQQSRIHSDLQEGLMQTRMVPFARLVPRLRRIVRQVCNELDKQARFDIENAEGEMDRSVLERMVSPLEHMLRNAVDHGIEPVAEREKAGKAAEGSIRLNLQREGGDVVLRLSDDGSGINVDNVRAKAIERGLMTRDADLSDHEILQFILTSGFSTAQQVTQISGRGVGMDVVHNEVKALGGTMDIATTPGTGTTFTVRLPFTVSVNRALMVGFGEDIYAIPLNTIDGVARVQPAQLAQYLDDENARFAYGTTQYKVRSLSDIMGSGHAVHVDELTEPQPVILVKALDRQEPLAMHVDRLMGSREVVVKTLGPQFAAVPSVSGATILGDGSVVVILDLPALLRSEVTTHSLEEAPEPAEDEVLALPDSPEPVAPVRAQRDENQPLTVMVVDDSVTVRKVTGRLLERQGMKVVTAKDGMDAITQLQDFEPDIILLDIEMPRMDGFEVANRVRHTERLSQIPIIMITSRTGEKHKERAFEIGVNDYMGKPFQEGPLLEAIGRLVEPDEQ
ncbi:MAG: Hpt domain-containing protein [Natronospirillum sp.]|uniref:Hpt domain-containing protein n=1 Tax=Natronospirillum sp. TaxID=2812955 RepID=UPI0025D5CA6C|nr:Hpt domain-containing protein [Natronospirillum sp.]MCH8551700.1 Hpt domain-containing protein [Natronospirillum sp.]